MNLTLSAISENKTEVFSMSHIYSFYLMCVCLGPLTIDTMVQHVRELSADVRIKRKPSNRESMEMTRRSEEVWGTGR